MAIPWNDKCDANVTTSLCDEDAIAEFRYYYSKERPVAIFLGSDGVDDSYPELPNDLYNLYRAICTEAINNGVNIVESDVEEFLPKLTAQASGDDVSIAGIIDEEALNAIDSVLNDMKLAREKAIEFEKKKRKTQIVERQIKEINRDLQRLQEKNLGIQRYLQGIFVQKNKLIVETDELKKQEKKANEELIKLSEEKERLTQELLRLENSHRQITEYDIQQEDETVLDEAGLE